MSLLYVSPLIVSTYILELMNMMHLSTPSSEATYDWTFTFKLSRPVFCKGSKDDNTIKFVKDSDNNLTGFMIEVENETDSKARETSEKKKKKLERILTILSGMELKALPAGVEGIPKKPGLRRVCNDLIVKYDIEGSIDNIDVTDPNTGNLINLYLTNELEYLSDAVAHKSHGRYSESIKDAFKIIEKRYSNKVTDYNKYRCIRDILSHREGQQLYQNTRKYFTCFFTPIRDKFGFKRCDESNGEFIFDLDSSKTKNTLELLAKDLIRDVKDILGFPK